MAKVLNDWQFQRSHVDDSALHDGGISSAKQGNYISSESIVLCAAPATRSSAAASAFSSYVPIGVCDSLQVVQNKGVIQLYEIGSRTPYIIPGRPMIQLSISRVLFNGDSLLASLTEKVGIDPTGFKDSVLGGPGSNFPVSGATTGTGNKSEDSHAFYLNLASYYFNTPFGLAIFFKDSENEWVAGYHAENCVIQQHSMAIQGQNMVVMENASVRCTSFAPIGGLTATA